MFNLFTNFVYDIDLWIPNGFGGATYTTQKLNLISVQNTQSLCRCLPPPIHTKIIPDAYGKRMVLPESVFPKSYHRLSRNRISRHLLDKRLTSTTTSSLNIRWDCGQFHLNINISYLQYRMVLESCPNSSNGSTNSVFIVLYKLKA